MSDTPDPRIEPVTHLATGQVWHHARRPISMRIVRFNGRHIQVADDTDNTLRWLTVDGLMRDYRLEASA